MGRSLLLAALAVGLGVHDIGEPQEDGRSTSIVPRSISEEARAFLLKGPAFPTETPRTLEDWKLLRANQEALARTLSESTRDTLIWPPEQLRFGDARVIKFIPRNARAEYKDKALIDIRGGGMCFGSAENTCFVYAPLAQLTGLTIYSVNCRLAPEHPFPVALDDCVIAYRGIIAKVQSENLGMFGESAGGSRCLVTLLKMDPTS